MLSHRIIVELNEQTIGEALRLRQRSLSTEKTYPIWVRSFRAFVKEKEPSQLEGHDLQDFLRRVEGQAIVIKYSRSRWETPRK